MISGMDKYFQIAKCFRDEDLRADRQPEFTQLDIECSFCNEDDIINLTESLMNNIFKSLIDKDSNLEFPRMRYEDAMKKYGCDKPDLRNPLELEDITQLMIKTEFKVFKDCTGSEKKRIVALNVPNGSAMSRKNIDEYTELVKNFGAKGLAYFKIDNVTDIEKGIISPIRKFLSDKEVKDILDIVKPKNGDLIFFSADTSDIVNSSMSSLINVLGKDLDIIEEGYKFLWITDYPMFEYENNTDKLTSLHHPFTSPSEDTKDNFTDKTLSRAYDLTLNGNEIGGGSVRIHNKSLQLSVFKALGLTDEEIESKFGFFLQALDYGCPPHAGIAFGLDRLVMILMHLPSIRDSIAFPKTQSSACLLTDAPTEISASQLRELSIKTNKIN
jgi:aspartyl-tRNA synthetase